MDPFQQVAAWDEATARRWATGLDERAADPQQVALRAGIVAAARLRPGQVAVEVGCGTGPLLAGLADAVGPTGRVLGVEPQPTLARIAARRLAGRAAVCLGTGAAAAGPVRDRGRGGGPDRAAARAAGQRCRKRWPRWCGWFGLAAG